jgi:hypothetical protein
MSARGAPASHGGEFRFRLEAAARRPGFRWSGGLPRWRSNGPLRGFDPRGRAVDWAARRSKRSSVVPAALSRSPPPCGAGSHRRELSRSFSLRDRTEVLLPENPANIPSISVSEGHIAVPCTAAHDRAGLKDVRPDAFRAHGGPVITRSSARRALCATRRVNPWPETVIPRAPAFAAPMSSS